MNKYYKLIASSLIFLSTTSCSVKNIWSNESSSDRSSLIDRESAYEETAERWTKVKSMESPVRGWEYVIDKLIKAGIDKKTLAEVYSDPKIPTWTPISFKVKPKESKESYSGHINKSSIKNATAFYKENSKYFKIAGQKFGVDQSVILSILQVETKCGKNTGQEPIIYWLSRLVSTGFPPNLTYNLSISKESPLPTLKEFEERANWLEEEFLPHLIATIKISSKGGVSPLEIIGSKGGAIGMPQFLPGNIEKFGIDGDKNGSVNIYTPADAIFSVANFLKSYGWKNSLSDKEKHTVILEYNRSTAYADTVMQLSKKLNNRI